MFESMCCADSIDASLDGFGGLLAMTIFLCTSDLENRLVMECSLKSAAVIIAAVIYVWDSAVVLWV